MISTTDLREHLRDIVKQTESTNATEAAVALERLYTALVTVTDELDDTISPDSHMVVMNRNRMCRLLGRNLGMEMPSE